MGKVEDIIEISKVLEIEVGTSNGSTLTKEWLIDVLGALEHELPVNTSNKVPIAEFISTKCGLEWSDDCYAEGSTVTEVFTSQLRNWVQINIQNPKDIEEMKEEVMETIEAIYQEAPSKFKPDDEVHFEDSLFEKFGENWTWLKSLVPVIKVIWHQKLSFDGNNLDEESVGNLLEDLNIDISLPEIEILRSLKNHLNVALTHLLTYVSSIEDSGLTEPKAYENWLESWEISEDEKEIVEPVIAYTRTWTIDKFADLARKNLLDTDPIYQENLFGITHSVKC